MYILTGILDLRRLQMDGKYAIAAAMALFNLQISKAIEILSTSKGQGQGQYFLFHFRHCQFIPAWTYPVFH